MPPNSRRSSTAGTAVSSEEEDDDSGAESEDLPRPASGCPMSRHSRSTPDSISISPEVSSKKRYGSKLGRNASFTSTTSTTAASYTEESTSDESEAAGDVGLSGDITKSLFPYHVMVDNDFTICQVGKDLPGVLKMAEGDIVGQHIASVLKLTKPVGVKWDWEWLRMLEDQSFDAEPVDESGNAVVPIRFKATVTHVSDLPPMTMIMLNPDANNLEDLREMNLTLSDLPVHGAHRDAIFLREHLSTQMNNALKMEKLSRSLTREKQLLESLLPEHAANGLRAGKTVEPMLHNNVTFFFSDIVGFTNLASHIYSWDIVALLNRLYGVMDLLAGKFNLFKVETIGDAYVCCSGLPQADEEHAKNVANFAIAVKHCCRQVLSPLDDTPIQLRIGVHSGSCASGVVGMTNPRYVKPAV
jgi:class 3 adenylate cyclase